MILFHEDWVNQYAFPNYRLNNTSFIKMAVLLKRMGIVNNKFFLALTQKELVDYDPHNIKDPSNELKLKCAIECKINPWYFFNTVVRLPSQGTDPIPYELNRANLALMWLFYNDIDTFLTIARQLGKTIGAIALEAWMIYIAGYHVNVGIFNKDNDLLKENVDRLKTIRDGIPDFILMETLKDMDNKEGLSYEELDNEFKTFVAQKDTRAAQGQGRGHSLAWQHWDEIAYYANCKLSHPSALAASNTAQRQVREQGIPCANIITTTAGSLQDPSGEYAYSLRCKSLRFTEFLYDCQNKEDLHTIVDNHSSIKMVYIEFHYKQLGKDDAWFKEVTRITPANLIPLDYLNQWQTGTNHSALPKHILDRLDDSLQEPFTCTYQDAVMLRWFVDPSLLRTEAYRNRTYIIGNDTADDVGRDYTTKVMIDAADLSVVCTFRCNMANFVNVAACICKFMYDFPRAILIPERNKHGAAVTDTVIEFLLSKNMNPLNRIYNLFYQDFRADVSLNNLDYGNGLVRKKFGFWTGKQSREVLYKSVLIPALEIAVDRLYDSDLINEFKGLTLRNGRIDHTEEGHDDLVVAWMLAVYFILRGKNLHLYGIDREEIMTKLQLKTSEAYDPVDRERQIQYATRVKQLEKIIDGTTSVMHRQALTRELNHLRTLLSEEDIDLSKITADEVHQDAIQQYNRPTLGTSTSFQMMQLLF